VQRGQAQFSTREANGWRLFNDPEKGNCLRCHTSSGTATRPALFTNFSYHALALPRNWQIVYNRDDLPQPVYAPSNGLTLGVPGHRYYDLGACGPFRTDLASQTEQCGKFRVPTLRNVALKGAYGHNGIFGDLFQVVDFYTSRDLQPARWYRKADGISPDLPYNDLPLQYQAQVAKLPPFHFLPGRIPRLTQAEQRDLVAFMCTLTDGYDTANPAGYRMPPQCLAAMQ
jgi:cytochrome c peroxidase